MSRCVKMLYFWPTTYVLISMIEISSRPGTLERICIFVHEQQLRNISSINFLLYFHLFYLFFLCTVAMYMCINCNKKNVLYLMFTFVLNVHATLRLKTQSIPTSLGAEPGFQDRGGRT